MPPLRTILSLADVVPILKLSPLVFPEAMLRPPNVIVPTAPFTPSETLPPERESIPAEKPVPDKDAPELTMILPAPRRLPVRSKFPAPTVVFPEYEETPDKPRVPAPTVVTAPVPLIEPEYVNVSLRLNANKPLFKTLELKEPVLDPPPTWSVPAAIAVVPE
jgi:hypothetical protein